MSNNFFFYLHQGLAFDLSYMRVTQLPELSRGSYHILPGMGQLGMSHHLTWAGNSSRLWFLAALPASVSSLYI